MAFLKSLKENKWLFRRIEAINQLDFILPRPLGDSSLSIKR